MKSFRQLLKEMTEQEALKILNLSSKPDPDHLKKVYRSAAMKNHPDRGGSDEAMKQINIAYEILTGQRKAGAYSRPGTGSSSSSGRRGYSSGAGSSHSYSNGYHGYNSKEEYDEAVRNREEGYREVAKARLKAATEAWDIGERFMKSSVNPDLFVQHFSTIYGTEFTYTFKDVNKKPAFTSVRETDVIIDSMEHQYVFTDSANTMRFELVLRLAVRKMLSADRQSVIPVDRFPISLIASAVIHGKIKKMSTDRYGEEIVDGKHINQPEKWFPKAKLKTAAKSAASSKTVRKGEVEKIIMGELNGIRDVWYTQGDTYFIPIGEKDMVLHVSRDTYQRKGYWTLDYIAMAGPADNAYGKFRTKVKNFDHTTHKKIYDETPETVAMFRRFSEMTKDQIIAQITKSQ